MRPRRGTPWKAQARCTILNRSLLLGFNAATEGNSVESGFGIEKLVGSRAVDENGKETVAPLLLMHYQMQQDAMIAQALGDQIQFEEQPDGSWVSITIPNPDRLRS
jgi:hypothetical protein